MKTQRGVTLIELMVTMAVLALLMFAVVPDIGSWMRNTQVRNASEAIHAGLERARNEAVKRNRTVQFTLVSVSNPGVVDNTCAPSGAAASWVVSLDDPAGLCGEDSSVTPFVVSSYAMAEGSRNVSVAAVQADGSAATSVTFDGFGRVVSAAASIDHIDIAHTTPQPDLRRLRVVISNTGSIRTCDRDVTDAADPRHCP